MSEQKKVALLLGALMLVFFLPYAGGWIFYGGTFPDDFFAFPTLAAPPKAGFSLPMFILIGTTLLVIALLYLFPRIFGFKKTVVPPSSEVKRAPLPIWFWLGLVVWGVTLIILDGKFSEPKWLINWAVIPLYWGFSLVIDGWVYARTCGKSIIGESPQEFLGIGVASISGWLVFEWLNFFVDDNWIYPKGDMIPQEEFFIYAIFGSSGLLLMLFEWYSLLNSFPGLKYKYVNGPKVKLPEWGALLMVIVSLASLALAAYYPDEMFFVIWLSPLIVLAYVLKKIGLWTPFQSMRDGNWSPFLLLGLAFLIEGVLCECWNYFSGYHTDGAMTSTFNPDYWEYSIPYVDVLHVFEMPLLGFIGYLPYGVYCGVWWVTFAYLLNIRTNGSIDKHISIKNEESKIL